ncbi:MAG TPA: SCP2 sterol-binding domain-containing protein [Gammaproteobacteria bacterium]
MNDTASMIPLAALLALEQALNATLALDPVTLRRLAAMQGKVLALEIQSIGVTLYLAPQHHGLRLMGHYDGEVDTTLRGAPLALLRLPAGRSGEGLFSGAVTIDGDVESGQQLQRILQGLDIDWEEHLSRLTGDVVGHQLGNLLRGLAAFGKKAVSTFGLNLGEYLQEERRTIPARAQVEAFVAEVDAVRMAADRLEARIKRLHKALHDPASSSQ